MTTKSKAEQLADLIENNPNCKIDIDNDVWYICEKTNGKELDSDDEDTEYKELANSEYYSFTSEWYSHSSNYGAGVADALVILLNRRGFNIEASAV